MELILSLNSVEIRESNNLNNSNFLKFKTIIILNIVAIILYIIFIYYNYNKFNKEENQFFIPNETFSFSQTIKNEEFIYDKDIKLSNLKKYNNKYYETTREKYLYERQKKLIFSSLINHKFIGEWNGTNNNSEVNLGESTVIFEKAHEKKTRQVALALEIKNKNGKYIDSWLKIISYSRYQNLYKRVNLFKKTFEISGLFLTDFEKGELFNTKLKQTKCLSAINITFPLRYVNINVTTLSGMNIYLGLMPTINNNNFTLNLLSNCSIGFNINAKIVNNDEEKEIKQGKLNLYFFLCLFSTILYGFGIIFIYCGIKNNEGYLSCINIEIFSLNSVWNSYCFVTHIYLAFITDFHFFIIICTIGLCSLLKFLSFDIIIYTKYWKIKDRRVVNNCQLVKLKLRFYFFLCLSIIGSLFLLTTFFINYYCIILLSLFLWFPQIIYNMISNNKYSYPFIFILSCSIDRLIYPFYFRAYNNNYFEIKSNIFIFILSIIIVIFSIIILFIQTFKGPRFILPLKYQENKFGFYKDFEELNNICKDINEECAICLMPIYPEDKYKAIEMKENNSKENKENDNTNDKEEIIESNILNVNTKDNNLNDSNKLLIKEENKEKKETEGCNNEINQEKRCSNFCMKMKIFFKDYFINYFFKFYKSSPFISKPYILTPCNHIFHSICLDKWLEVKSDCPCCRKSLETNF